MFSPRFHNLILLWAIAWFGVVLPGHERGVIRVPGAPTVLRTDTERRVASGELQLSALSACPLCPLSRSGEDGEDPASTCALCQLIATLSVPVPFDPVPTAGERLIERPRIHDFSAPLRPVLARSLGRAPPF